MRGTVHKTPSGVPYASKSPKDIPPMPVSFLETYLMHQNILHVSKSPKDIPLSILKCPKDIPLGLPMPVSPLNTYLNTKSSQDIHL